MPLDRLSSSHRPHNIGSSSASPSLSLAGPFDAGRFPSRIDFRRQKAGGDAMAGRLAGKIALISGGATGMGGASSRLFAAEGAKVGVVDRNEEAGYAVAAEIRAAGGTAMFAKADVADEAQVNSAVAAVAAELGTVNVLFNHAGSIIIKPFLETTLAEWNWLMAVNVTSMFLMTKAVLPGMIATGGGSIVCTSSISAIAATPREVVYNAS